MDPDTPGRNAPGSCSVDEIEAAFLASRRPIPLDSLFSHFRDYPDLDAYVTATSLVSYIQQRYGTSAVRAIWQPGAGRIEDVLGMPLDELERD